MKTKTIQYVTREFNLNVVGHEHLDFLDVNLATDQKLFIDPCLIETVRTPFCQRANMTINSFFDEFFQAYRDGNHARKEYLLSHAEEINDTRLGYGNGQNGHGNTPSGLLEKLRELDNLSKRISSFGKAIDLPVFVPGFDKDGLSDMLTNIIHRELNDFTLEQFEKWNIAPNDEYDFCTWDSGSNSWKVIHSPCYVANTGRVLLVPKHIVRFRYLCNVGQFFSRVVLERMQREQAFLDEKGRSRNPSKSDLEATMDKSSEHWKYDYAVDSVSQNPEELNEYHRRIHEFYSGCQMTDDELDKRLYK